MRSLCWDTAQFATADDVESFYGSLSDAERLQLRKLITYNTSFWAIDWTKMVSTNKDWVSQFVFDQQDEDMAGKYMWWRECGTKKVPLPPRSGGKAIVFHYHPLAAAEYLADHLPPPPLFFVKRSDKEYVVARPGDINIAAKEKVWVYEPPLPDWLLGTGETLLQGGQQYSGIGNFGETDLHEALIDPATAPGVPVLDASTKRIWASIWKSEGCLEALNTYDRAFLSFGPIQQTRRNPERQG